MSAELDLRAVLEGKRRQKSPSNFVNVNGSPLRRIVDDDDNRPISPRRSRSRNRSRSRSAGSPSKQRDWMEPERPLPLLPSSPSRINVDEILLLEQEVERSQREIDRKIAENERRQQEIVNLQMDALEETEEMTMPRDDVASLGSLPSEDETTIPMALDIDEGGPELSHLDEEREKSPGFDTVEDGSDEPAPPGEEDTKRDRVKKSVSASDGANEEKNKVNILHFYCMLGKFLGLCLAKADPLIYKCKRIPILHPFHSSFLMCSLLPF